MFKCVKCGVVKEVKFFHRDKYRSRGHKTVCSVCCNDIQRAQRHDQDRPRMAYDPEKESKRVMDAQLREKNKCRKKTREAVKRGELVKGVCAVCGVKEVEAHHKDYTNPLKVTWLCNEHHNDEHRYLAAKEAIGKIVNVDFYTQRQRDEGYNEGRDDAAKVVGAQLYLGDGGELDAWDRAWNGSKRDSIKAILALRKPHIDKTPDKG